MLGHVIKDNIQLVILKDLHVILRWGDIVREYLRYHLDGTLKSFATSCILYFIMLMHQSSFCHSSCRP